MEIIAVILLIVFFIKLRSIKYNIDSLLRNLLFYPAVLSTFYLLLPIWFHNEGLQNLFELDFNYLDWVTDVGLYYVIIFWACFIFSKSVSYQCGSRAYKCVDISRLQYVLTGCSLSLCAIIVTNIDVGVINVDRVAKYEYYARVIKSPGFTLLSWFVLIWVYVLIFYTKKLTPVVYLIPLLALELVCSSRFYFLVAFAMYITYYIADSEKKLFLPLLFILVFFAFVGVFRDATENYTSTDFLVSSSGEFINTWYSTYIVWLNGIASEHSPLIVLLQRALPGFVFDSLSMNRTIYTDYISDFHGFSFGLGSSAIAEAYSYNMVYLYPIFVIIPIIIINRIRDITCNVGVLRILSFVYIYSIFRGGAINNAGSLIMVYVLVFLIPYFFFVCKKNRD